MALGRGPAPQRTASGTGRQAGPGINTHETVAFTGLDNSDDGSEESMALTRDLDNARNNLLVKLSE